MLLIYNFKIFYRKENDNIKADALSRRVDHTRNIKSTSQSILRENENGIIIYNHIMIASTFQISDQDQKS